MSELVKRISRAYWPNPEKHEPADREAGDKVVDGLTLGELREFFNDCHAGPTYCMVKHRFMEHLANHFSQDLVKAARNAKAAGSRFLAELRKSLDAAGLLDD